MPYDPYDLWLHTPSTSMAVLLIVILHRNVRREGRNQKLTQTLLTKLYHSSPKNVHSLALYEICCSYWSFVCFWRYDLVYPSFFLTGATEYFYNLRFVALVRTFIFSPFWQLTFIYVASLVSARNLFFLNLARLWNISAQIHN